MTDRGRTYDVFDLEYGEGCIARDGSRGRLPHERPGGGHEYRTSPGRAVSDALWEALAESRALIAILSSVGSVPAHGD